MEQTIERLTADRLDLAAPLFAEYPYKALQQQMQRLEHARLEKFYAAGLARAVAAGIPHWAVRQNHEALALAGLVHDVWHSEVYGFKMGKVQPWLNTWQPEVGRELLHTLEDVARADEYAHLALRIDGEDFPNLHLLEEHGWRLIDVSLKLTRPMPIVGRLFALAPEDCAGFTIDTAQPEDAEWIRELGSTTHGAAHLLNDPALPWDRTRELFARWLDRCLEQLAWRIFVLRDGEGVGRGFVTYLRSPAFAEAVGRRPLILDFLLLGPKVRGRGLGPWFVEETLSRAADSGFDYCELRTSAHNLPAVASYEKVGFRCCASDFVMHKKL